MSKKCIWLVIFFFIVVSGMVGISAVEGGEKAQKVEGAKKAQKVEDEILLQNKYEKDKGYEASLFTHKKHGEEYKNDKGEAIECADCHHLYKTGVNVWKEGDHVDKCIKCHNGVKNYSPSKPKKLLKEGKLTKEEMVKELSWAYHENCYNCHKAVKAVNKKANAPKSCAKCHKKIKKKK